MCISTTSVDCPLTVLQDNLMKLKFQCHFIQDNLMTWKFQHKMWTLQILMMMMIPAVCFLSRTHYAMVVL